LENILDLGNLSGIACPDEIDLEMELKSLTFSKSMGVGTETDVEGAIMDLLHMITEDLEDKTSKESVLQKFTRRI
jgi:hypothetical protein